MLLLQNIQFYFGGKTLITFAFQKIYYRREGNIQVDAFNMPPAFSVPSREKWRKYEQGSMAKQQEFMERYREDFKKVLVENSDGIQAGDHLVLERKYYVHHMLCTFSGDNHVIVIHYSGPAWGISKASRCTSFKDVGVKGEIEEKMFSSEELVEQQVRTQ